MTSHHSLASLYFHIPFCSQKCPYCHFYVVPNRPLFHQILKEGLDLEWKQRKKLLEGKELVSIYFGGGTPSLFPHGIGALLKTISPSNCEITVEVNPEESSSHLFETLLSYGVNRLSIGIQSLDDRSLQTLERTHTAKQAIHSILEAEKAGFQNISIDLMYDLPNQTASSWRYTLDQLSSLPIQHLSLYNLTIEPHTAFYKRQKKLSFPDAKTSLQFLNDAVKTIEASGLKRYEISAFSKPGFESCHNLGYWTGRPFLGFGPSAFSYWKKERFCNVAHLQRYVRQLKEGKSPIDFRERLLYPRDVTELFAVRLRLLEGATIEQLPQETLDTIKRLVDQNFLQQNGKRIRLSEKGLLFYDTVAAEIVSLVEP